MEIDVMYGVCTCAVPYSRGVVYGRVVYTCMREKDGGWDDASQMGHTAQLPTDLVHDRTSVISRASVLCVCVYVFVLFVCVLERGTCALVDRRKPSI